MLFASGLITGRSNGMRANPVHITHQYANIDSQSLIGLPFGSDKTIIDKHGNLRWSQWSIRHRDNNVPFGISSQMDGALDIRLLSVAHSDTPTPLKVAGQMLYHGRFPFVVTNLKAADGLTAEELAFPVKAAGMGIDVVRITLKNPGSRRVSIDLQVSGKDRNIPAFVKGQALATQDGRVIALMNDPSGTFSSRVSRLTLSDRINIAPLTSYVLWLKRPFDWESTDDSILNSLEGPELLKQAVYSWEEFWGHGMQIELPEKEIEDFFYSSFAYLFILTEHDAQGTLSALDGPTIYRHFWPRNEFYPAYAMDMVGYPSIATQTIQYLDKIQMSDGRWDMPLLTSPFAWDSIGYAMATNWTHYEFTHDKAWLEQMYPHLIGAARWVQYNRENTELPPDAPEASRPAKPYLTFSCQGKVTPTPLAPGEKPFSYGLLPFGFGDSGLPDGHPFTHNIMPLYGIRCARQAALALGRTSDAGWLEREYASYKTAILTSINRAVKLERGNPPYLPATPTCPHCAWSQTLRAVFPSELFPPNDPLVTGLLVRMRRSARQGLPTNMGFLGPSGVWPGESMEVAQTYLLRGDVKSTVELLLAALNHATTTDVWKEEILVDKNLPTACSNHPHGIHAIDQTGTGDQPEGWAHANLIMLVRNMFLREQGKDLYLLSGIPSDWISPGQTISVHHAPSMFGNISYTLNYLSPGRMTFNAALPASIMQVIARFPIAENEKIVEAYVNGKSAAVTAHEEIVLTGLHGLVHAQIRFK